MNWLSTFMQYFPAVMVGVVGVQTALKNQPGATKKAVVLDAIMAGAKAGELIPNTHVAGISALIDTVVTTLKATDTTGLFGVTPVAADPSVTTGSISTTTMKKIVVAPIVVAPI